MGVVNHHCRMRAGSIASVLLIAISRPPRTRLAPQNRSEALQIVKASSRESGTTAAVAVMWGSNALVSMVGDSVAYLVSKVVIPPRSKASGAKERAAEGPAGIPSQRASQRAGTSNRTGSASVPPGDGGRRSMDLVAAEGVLAESVPAAVAVPNAILVVNPFPHKPVGSEADRIRCGRSARLRSRAHGCSGHLCLTLFY